MEASKKSTKYEPIPNCRQRIIVADDMKFIIVAMMSLMKQVFKIDDLVTYARDGQQVVEIVKESLQHCREEDYRPYSLLILDFNMPYLNGIEVVKKVRNLHWVTG